MLAEMPPIKLMAKILRKDMYLLEMFFEFTEVTESKEQVPKRYWRIVSFASEMMREPFMRLRPGHEATVEMEAGDEGERYKLHFEKVDPEASLIMWLNEFEMREGPLE